VANRQRVAAYGVCVDQEGRLLLARASSSLTIQGTWFLPGGGLHHGESPSVALRREIAEEAGLTVELGPLLNVLSDVRELPDGTSLHTLRVIYRVASWTGTLRAEQHGTTDAVRWLSREEMKPLRLAHYVEKVIDEFL